MTSLAMQKFKALQEAAADDEAATAAASGAKRPRTRRRLDGVSSLADKFESEGAPKHS